MSEKYDCIDPCYIQRMRDSKDIKGLLKALSYEKDYKSWEVRAEAAEALKQLGDKSAVEPLIHALKDISAEVRRRAAEALGRLGDTRAVEPLVALLKEDEDWEVLMDEKGDIRPSVAEALDRLGWIPENDIDKVYYLLAKRRWDALAELGAVAVEPLIKNLYCGWDYWLQVDVATTLGKIGDARAVEPLAEIMNETNFETGLRCRAAEALGKIGDVRAVEPLRQALVDDKYFKFKVRACVALALERLGWKPVADVEKAYYLIAKGEWRKVIELGEVAVLPLIRALWNEDDESEEEQLRARGRAAQALAEIKDKRALEAIIKAVERGIHNDDYRALREGVKRVWGIDLNSYFEGLKRRG